MDRFSTLPEELLLIIIKNVLEEEDSNVTSAIAAVNKKFRRIAIPISYREIELKGKYSAHRFLRNLLMNDDMVNSVKSLSVRLDKELPSEDLVCLKEAKDKRTVAPKIKAIDCEPGTAKKYMDLIGELYETKTLMSALHKTIREASESATGSRTVRPIKALWIFDVKHLNTTAVLSLILYKLKKLKNLDLGQGWQWQTGAMPERNQLKAHYDYLTFVIKAAISSQIQNFSVEDEENGVALSERVSFNGPRNGYTGYQLGSELVADENSSASSFGVLERLTHITLDGNWRQLRKDDGLPAPRTSTDSTIVHRMLQLARLKKLEMGSNNMESTDWILHNGHRFLTSRSVEEVRLGIYHPNAASPLYENLSTLVINTRNLKRITLDCIGTDSLRAAGLGIQHLLELEFLKMTHRVKDRDEEHEPVSLNSLESLKRLETVAGALFGFTVFSDLDEATDDDLHGISYQAAMLNHLLDVGKAALGEDVLEFPPFGVNIPSLEVFIAPHWTTALSESSSEYEALPEVKQARAYDQPEIVTFQRYHDAARSLTESDFEDRYLLPSGLKHLDITMQKQYMKASTVLREQDLVTLAALYDLVSKAPYTPDLPKLQSIKLQVFGHKSWVFASINDPVYSNKTMRWYRTRIQDRESRYLLKMVLDFTASLETICTEMGIKLEIEVVQPSASGGVFREIEICPLMPYLKDDIVNGLLFGMRCPKAVHGKCEEDHAAWVARSDLV